MEKQSKITFQFESGNIEITLDSFCANKCLKRLNSYFCKSILIRTKENQVLINKKRLIYAQIEELLTSMD